MMRVLLIIATIIYTISYNLAQVVSESERLEKKIDLAQGEKMLKKNLPAFRENKGQITGEDSQNVKFIYKDQGLSIFFLNNGIAYQFESTQYPDEYKQFMISSTPEDIELVESLKKKIIKETYRMDVTLVGANTNVRISTEGQSADYVNYYKHDALNVYSYRKLTYHNVYPNIDWVIYTSSTYLKYDFIVHPGGDPSLIKLQTNWVEDLKLNQDGSLTMINRMGSVTEKRPVSFQGKREISTNFTIHENTICFNLENYRTDQTLIIDPSLLWSSFYGGNEEDTGQDCVVDNLGNVYLAGNTESSFAIAMGGHQSNYGGGDFGDAFIVKFNSLGERLWASYYGGDGSDSGQSCAVDDYGNVYLAGGTSSSAGISHQGHQNNLDGFNDAYLVKFNSLGARLWATYFGGSNTDFASSCFADDFGNIYLAGSTNSILEIAFNGHQNSLEGGLDAFLVKFNSAGVRQWASYYGGSENDRGQSCVTDGVGNVYLVGYTNSTDNIAFNGYQNDYGGGFNDAFIVKFSSLGERQWASYFGGVNEDEGRSCAIDGSGNVYLAGNSNTSSGLAFNGHQNLGGGTYDGFLAKFNSQGTLEWSTYYGGENYDVAHKCAVDDLGNVFIAGQTASESGIAYGNYQNTYGGGAFDAFLVKFNSFGNRQWSTYFGGAGIVIAKSCAIDNMGKVYLIGQATLGSDITFGGHQEIHGTGVWDAFIAKFDCEDCSIGVEQFENDFELTIFPNPTNGQVQVNFGTEFVGQMVTLSNAFGQVIQSKRIEEVDLLFDLSNFANGVYYLTFTIDGSQVSKKIILN